MRKTKEIRSKLTDNSLQVLEKRYLKKNEEGKVIETPEEMFKRVAKAIAEAEFMYGVSSEEVDALYEKFYNIMISLDFLPNSPTLMNAGTELGQLCACFVLPVEDSMEGIFEAIKHAALIHKSGGGTGFSFSRLRPKGDVVGSTKGISSGPVSFMLVFDTATEAVKQGGRRRGANMGILRVDHPDIIEFITCKDDNDKLTNFNISVALTEEFMKALKKNGEYALMNPRLKRQTKKLKAKEVFDLIVKQAWKNGEPGIIFLDRINKYNPTPQLGEIESTNPCGEVPLLPYEACVLGSINLANMVKDGNVNWEKLKETTHTAVHFLDNIIDVNKYPLDEIAQMTKANRKIGLGVMGWADMLIQLGIPYNTKEALLLAENVMKFIQKEGRQASCILATKKGVFPNLSKSIYANKIKIRNATITTIAPTGSLSIIAGCSFGIEPIFAVCFIREVLEGTKLVEVNPYFKKIAKQQGFYSKELMEEISERGTLTKIRNIPEKIKKLFITAHDITPEDHIRMQAAFQKYVDNAVSKTVNFPNHATEDDIRKVYLLAYELDCKGVTVYRDGSRQIQVLTKGKKEGLYSEGSRIIPRKRPEVIKGTTRVMKTGCGNLYVTINEDEKGQPFEVFNHIGKAGGCADSQAEAIGRLVSLALRSNIAPEEIIKQLKGISCHQHTWAKGGKISSCADAIAKALELYLTENKGNKGNEKRHCGKNIICGACPECGGAIEMLNGCAVCRNCGYTKCE